MFPRVFNYDNSKVTLELRELVESGVNVWDFEYPSYYTNAEKVAFEQKVIDHFFFRQIGQETPARWLHYFRSRVREVMPYYIQLYKSVELMEKIEDPLESYNLTEEYTRDTENTGSTSSNGSSTSNETRTDTREDRFSNTPQGSISNIDTYMSEARKNDDTSTGEGSSTTEGSSQSSDKGKETYKLTRRGNIGVQPLGQEIKILRDSFINIDMMIIRDLEDLFLKVY